MDSEVVEVSDENWVEREEYERVKSRLREAEAKLAIAEKDYEAMFEQAGNLLAERDRLRGLLSHIEFELKHPMMDGSNIVRARELAERRQESKSTLKRKAVQRGEDPSGNQGVSRMTPNISSASDDRIESRLREAEESVQVLGLLVKDLEAERNRLREQVRTFEDDLMSAKDILEENAQLRKAASAFMEYVNERWNDWPNDEYAKRRDRLRQALWEDR